MSNAHKTATATINQTSRILKELFEELEKLAQKAGNHRDDLQVIKRESEREGYCATHLTDAKSFPAFMAQMKKNDLKMYAVNIKDTDQIMVYFCPKDAEKVRLCAERAYIDRNYREDISKNDYMKYHYGEVVEKYKNVDALEVEKLKTYAKRLRFTFAKEQQEDGKYAIYVTKRDQELLNKAMFCVHYDLTGKFRNLEEERIQNKIELEMEKYDRIREVPIKGPIHIYNKDNINEVIIINHDSYVHKLGDYVIEQDTNRNPNFKDNLEKNIRSIKNYALVEPEELKEKDLKQAIREYRKKEIFVSKQTLEELKVRESIKTAIITDERIDFKRTASMDLSSLKIAKEIIAAKIHEAQEKYAEAVQLQEKARANGHNINLPQYIDQSIDHLTEVNITTKIVTKGAEEIVVDEGLISLGDIEFAKEYAYEKASEVDRELEDGRELAEDMEYAYDEAELPEAELDEEEVEEEIDEPDMDLPDELTL